MIDPGAEPRQRLRYEFVPHVPEHGESLSKLRITVAATNTRLNIGHRTTEFPTFRIAGRAEVNSITADGGAIADFVVEDASVLDDADDSVTRKALEAEGRKLKGLHGTWQVGPSGAVSNVVFDAANASGSLRQRISTIADNIRKSAVVLPAVPVGVGAIWEVSSDEPISGITFHRTVKCRLMQVTDSSVVVLAEVVMRASDQALSVEPNATTKLTSGTVNSTSELTVPLHGLFATGTAHESGEINLLLVRGRQRVSSNVQTEAEYSLKRLDTTPPAP